ncbi:hypothetical protein D3C87_2053490 [compost metagenome]
MPGSLCRPLILIRSRMGGDLVGGDHKIIRGPEFQALQQVIYSKGVCQQGFLAV